MPTPLGTPPSVGSIANASDPLNVRDLHHLQLGFLGIIDRREPAARSGRWRGLRPRRSPRDAERVRAHPDRGRQGRPVAQVLSDLDGVQLAEDLVGPYDVIARVQAPGLDQLGRLVVARIQVVDGVTRTLTCTVLHR